MDDVGGTVAADTGDAVAADGDVRFDGVAGEDVEHAAAAEHQVGGLVAAGDGEEAGPGLGRRLGR